MCNGGCEEKIRAKEEEIQILWNVIKEVNKVKVGKEGGLGDERLVSEEDIKNRIKKR